MTETPVSTVSTTYKRTLCGCARNVLVTMRHVHGEYPTIEGEVPVCPGCGVPFQLDRYHAWYGRSVVRIPPPMDGTGPRTRFQGD
jgi:hypothetical protein